jgi:hypothetical protein
MSELAGMPDVLIDEDFVRIRHVTEYGVAMGTGNRRLREGRGQVQCIRRLIAGRFEMECDP